jgi:large subunit ribosomal protein L15
LAKKTNKTHKLRGSREHGRGMKKGRGAGLRGGKGQAGWKHKKLHFLLYDKDRIRGARNHGFTRHADDTTPDVSITVQHVDEQVPSWAQEGKAARADNGFTVDLGAMGFDKLVGTGQVTQKLQLTVPRASAGAVQKVQAAGGSVNQTNPPPPPKPKAKPGAPPPGGAKGGAPPPGGKPKEAKSAKAEGKPAAPKEGKAPAPKGGAKGAEQAESRKQQK